MESLDHKRALPRHIGHEARYSVILLSALFLVLFLIPLKAEAIPYEVIPFGAVRLEYDQRLVNGNSNNRVISRLDAGAVGFVLDKQFIKYTLDAGTAIYTGSSSDIGDRTFYRFGVDLIFLELYPASSWKLRRLPHPLHLSYRRYQDGFGVSTSYSAGISWNLPKYIQFMGPEGFVSLTFKKGRKEAEGQDSQTGQQEWEQVWNNQQQFQSQAWQDQQVEGMEGWDEDLGPTGWGNASGQWNKDENVEIEEKKRRERESPLFTMPFPHFNLSASRSERELDDGRTSIFDQLRFSTNVIDDRYSLNMDLTRNTREDLLDGGADTSNTVDRLDIRHRYRADIARSGELEKVWSVSNRLVMENRDVTSGSNNSSIQYRLDPEWSRRNKAKKSTLGLDSSFDWYTSENYSNYGISGTAHYEKEFSPVLKTQVFTGAGFITSSGLADSNSLSTNVGGWVDWDFSRYVSGRGDLALQYNSHSNGEGTFGFSGLLSLRSKTMVKVTSNFTFGYDAVDTRRNSVNFGSPSIVGSGEVFGRASSFFLEEELSAYGNLLGFASWRARGLYRTENRTQGQTDNTLRADLSAGVPRLLLWASASAGMTVQRFWTESALTTSERLTSSFYANVDTNPFRGLTANLRYNLLLTQAETDSILNGFSSSDNTFQNIIFSAQYSRFFWSILTGIRYTATFKMPGIGDDVVEHRILVTAERTFSERPARY